jgi:ankyrin repeat protein
MNSNFSIYSIAKTALVTLALIFLSSMAWAENHPLIESSRHHDAEEVQQLLAEGADPDVRQADGATALHWAAYREDADMLAALVQAGANVNVINRLGASPLYLAAKSGNAELIESLVRAGADPDLALQEGETPLMTAARAGTVKGVEVLVAAGADVNVHEQSRGQTALMWAAAQGHAEVARALINAGANLEAKSNVRPRLMYFESSNGAAFDLGNEEQLGGYSPLLFAAARGHVEVGELLIRSGVDVDNTAANGASPLVVAIHSGHTNFAHLLLAADADPDAIDAGYNALHAAVLRGNLEIVEALLKSGADPDVRLERATPVQRGSEDWALKSPLVSATPYWIAAYYREAKIMTALRQGGANHLLTTRELFREKGRTRADRLNPPEPKVVGGFATALQAAIRGDSTRSRFYTQANSDPIGEEGLALDAVIVAAEHGINLDHADFAESTAIHYAAQRNLPTVVRELANRGADINALNGRGQTPLDLAIAMENSTDFFNFDARLKPGPKTSEVLVEFGALTSN